MARPKGQPKLGGRQKGTPNKVSNEAINIFKKAGFDPLRRAIALYNKTDDDNIKAQLLGKMMKYRYHELKAIEISGDIVHWTPELIMSLSDTQLQMFMATFQQQGVQPIELVQGDILTLPAQDVSDHDDA